MPGKEDQGRTAYYDFIGRSEDQRKTDDKMRVFPHLGIRYGQGVVDGGLPPITKTPPMPPVKPPRKPFDFSTSRIRPGNPEVLRIMKAVDEGRMTFQQAFFHLMNELFAKLGGF